MNSEQPLLVKASESLISVDENEAFAAADLYCETSWKETKAYLLEPHADGRAMRLDELLKRAFIYGFEIGKTQSNPEPGRVTTQPPL